MPLQNYDDLNDMHIDVLREIGNIGSGNAASSLAMLLSDTIDISVPTVRILDYEQVMEELGGPEQMVVGELLCLEGDVEGMIMFLLHENFANQVLQALLGEDAPTAANLDEISGSALQEVANIMAASYVNAISGMTGFTIDITVPSMCVDMLGAVLSVPAIHYANISDKMIFIEDKFSGKDLNAPNHILLIPDVDSLEKIMTSLGIEL
ncbi:MAG: chemotaxis protein CheC [Oscillospiraceae bacterium]|jgi:chemotaxis protein CheC|nr:chemotaxis protein CheC [Oscillospiraceae bacterium]